MAKTVAEVKQIAADIVTKTGEGRAQVDKIVITVGEVKSKLDSLIAGGQGATPEELQELFDVLQPVPQALADASNVLDVAERAADITP